MNGKYVQARLQLKVVNNSVLAASCSRFACTRLGVRYNTTVSAKQSPIKRHQKLAADRDIRSPAPTVTRTSGSQDQRVFWQDTMRRVIVSTVLDHHTVSVVTLRQIETMERV